MRRARSLDPTSLIICAGVARVFYFARRYDEAIQESRATLDLDPNFWVAHYFLGRAYAQKGLYDDALEQLRKARTLSENWSEALSLIGYVCAVSGANADACQAIAELKERATRGYVQPYHIAMVYAGLGKDDVFEWLEKAYVDRNQWLTLLRVAPEFDSVRHDARFVALERRVGLVP